MRRLRSALARLSGLFARNRRDQAFDAELESHLQLHIDDNLRAGMSPEQARREAIIKLGGIESTRQAYRERSSVPFLEHAGQDLRFALRHLAKTPGFTITAILTLTLGCGATLAIYAFVDAALIAPLPYADPARLMDVTERSAQVPHANLSYPDYLDWKRQNTVFSSLDFHSGRRFGLTMRDGVQPVMGARVSAGFFGTLGVAPVMGRDFHAGEDQPGTAMTAIISFAAWQARFGGQADVVGRTVTLDGKPCTIVGVLPQRFHFALRGPVEFWVPFHQAGGCDSSRGCHALTGVGRLRTGVTLEAAQAGMQAIASQLERQYPDSNKGQGAVVGPLSEQIVGNIRPILLLLASGAGLLLAIAWINIVSLLLVRSEGRRRELAGRSTLGASNGRLMRQFVTEALVLVAAGTACGLAAAAGTIRLLLALMSDDMRARMPYLDAVDMNWRVGACAGALALLATVLFSIAPAVRLRFSEMREGLAEGSRGSSGVAWRRLGFKLVVCELATAMVLLVGAGLLGKSLYHLLNVNLGFEPDSLVTIQLGARGGRFAEDGGGVPMAREVTARLSRLPGIESVSLAELLPVSFNGNTNWIRFVGRPYNGEHNEVNWRPVSPGYLATMRARMVRGRGFTDQDTATAPHVVIVNQALVRKYFGSENPLGKQLGDTNLQRESLREIVGVVADIREGALNDEIWSAVYCPIEQDPTRFFAVVARVRGNGESALPSLRDAIGEVDPDIVTMEPAAMRERIQDSPAAYLQRSSAWLAGGFAGLALVLGIIGLYGVIAYSVSQRTREIGLRLALGAERRRVYELVLGEAGRLVLAGVAIGIVASIAAGQLMGTLLFGTTAWDLPTFGGVAVLLALAALLASYIPARRAASVNPIEALRVE